MNAVYDLTPLLEFLGARRSADTLVLHVAERDGQMVCAAVLTPSGCEPICSEEWAA